MKFLKLSILTLIITSMAACSYVKGEDVQGGQFVVIGKVGEYDELKHKDTGCHYLERKDSYSLTPFYNQYGEVKGCGNE